MINVEANIISKVLVISIKHIMHTSIHHDQTAYVKNRFTGESIRLIDDILEYADDNDMIYSEAMEIITTLASSLSCATGTDSRSSHNWKMGRRTQQ